MLYHTKHREYTWKCILQLAWIVFSSSLLQMSWLYYLIKNNYYHDIKHPTTIKINNYLMRKSRHWNKHAPNFLEAQCAFKDLMTRVLRIALRIAFRCVLHRRKSLDIHCRKLFRIRNLGWIQYTSVRYSILGYQKISSSCFYLV